MVGEGDGVWVLDGAPASIERFIDEVGASHRRLEGVANQIARAGEARDTRLPGWTTAHLLCHVERNAASHIRMLEGARLGEIVEQYEGGDAGRRAEIEAGSGRAFDDLVTRLVATNRALEAQWALMPPDAWHNATIARAGTRPAYFCLWARWREVELHTVDLDCGVEPVDWPEAFAVAGLDVSFRGLELRPIADRLSEGVRLELRDETRRATWRSHPASDATHIGAASIQQLLGWVVGRGETSAITWTNGAPDLAPWP